MLNRHQITQSCLNTVAHLIATKPFDPYLAHLILHALDPIYQALQDKTHGTGLLKFSLSGQERALLELVSDIRNLENLSLPFDDYRPHFKRALSLIQKLIADDIQDIRSLDGYDRHLEELKTFYLELQRNPLIKEMFESPKQH
jgi:hypothetical protein